MGEKKRRLVFEEKVREKIAEIRKEREMILTVVCIGANTLIGEYDPVDGILMNPRGVTMGHDQRGQIIIGLSNLAGEPEMITIRPPDLMYEVKHEGLINLYIKATTNLQIAPAGTTIPPGRKS